MRRALTAMAGLVLGIGISFAYYASRLPIYIGDFSPTELATRLYSANSSDEASSVQWYLQLHAHETPHKALFDLGAGLMAFGLGLFIAIGLFVLYSKSSRFRCVSEVLKFWVFAWTLELPGSFWILKIRQGRGDYPPWGDSIGLPIFGEVLFCVLGGSITTVILWLFLRRRALFVPLHFSQPRSILEWMRSTLLVLWSLFLLVFSINIIPDGEIGTVMSCIVASAVILIVIAAPPAANQI